MFCRCASWKSDKLLLYIHSGRFIQKGTHFNYKKVIKKDMIERVRYTVPACAHFILISTFILYDCAEKFSFAYTNMFTLRRFYTLRFLFLRPYFNFNVLSVKWTTAEFNLRLRNHRVPVLCYVYTYISIYCTMGSRRCSVERYSKLLMTETSCFTALFYSLHNLTANFNDV